MRSEDPPKPGPHLLGAAPIKGQGRRKLVLSQPLLSLTSSSIPSHFFPSARTYTTGFYRGLKPGSSQTSQRLQHRLGMLKHPVLWTELLLNPWPFCQDTANVGLLGPQPVRGSNKSEMCVYSFILKICPKAINLKEL